MTKFAIFSPSMGQREDFPVILLDSALTSENSNIQIWDGELRTAKNRKPEMLRNIYSILEINTTSQTITINDDFTAIFTSGQSISIYDSDSNYEDLTIANSAIVSGDTVITTVEAITADNYGYVYVSDSVVSTDPDNAGFRQVPIPDGNPIIRYERFILSDGITEMLVAFTKAHIYFWQSATTTWNLIFTCSGDCEYWDATIYGNWLCATNNIDRPIKWDGDSGTTFSNIDTQLSASTSDYVIKARFIQSYKNYLFLGCVVYADGSVNYPDYVVWSNIGEGVLDSGFRQDTGKDGGTAYIDGNGDISGGFGVWQGYLCVFKRYSIRKVWYVGGAIPFNQENLNPAVGCVSPGSIVNDKDGNLFYYGTDKSFREVSLGSISAGLVKTARDINPEYVMNVRSVYVHEYDELWWAIPYDNDATDNNKIITFKAGKWGVRDIAVVSFGVYVRQYEVTWDTLPYLDWDSWSWDTWDTTDANTDFPIDICSDSSGLTYEVHGAFNDKGDDYTSYFVMTTDLANKQALSVYKRILQMYFYFRDNGSDSDETANIYIKRDTETNWQSLGSVNLSGSEAIIRKRLAVDVRGRHFEIKVSSTDAFNFIGVEFEFEVVGDR